MLRSLFCGVANPAEEDIHHRGRLSYLDLKFELLMAHLIWG